MVQWYRAGLLVNRPSDRSCTRGMIHNKIPLISRGCPRSSVALQLQDCGLKHHSFHVPVTTYYRDLAERDDFGGNSAGWRYLLRDLPVSGTSHRGPAEGDLHEGRDYFFAIQASEGQDVTPVDKNTQPPLHVPTG